MGKGWGGGWNGIGRAVVGGEGMGDRVGEGLEAEGREGDFFVGRWGMMSRCCMLGLRGRIVFIIRVNFLYKGMILLFMSKKKGIFAQFFKQFRTKIIYSYVYRYHKIHWRGPYL